MTAHHALIIDDQRINALVLTNLLIREGIPSTSVIESDMITPTLQMIDTPSVIFLDLEMPGLDGYAVIKLLRDDDRFAAVPVVAYTVHVSQFQEAYEAGFHSFLAKPIDPQRFPHQLQRILSGEPVWDRI